MSIRSRHHGMAYLMVMLTLAIAGVLGMATLASSAMSAQAAATQQLSAHADSAADSAMQIALYGLQYPSAVPSAWSSTMGHALYASNVTLDGSVGDIDIDAVSTGSRDQFKVTATGRSAVDASIARSNVIQTKLVRSKPAFVGIFGAATTVANRVTFTGPVLSDGAVSFAGNGTISGGISTNVRSTDFQIPTLATVNFYGAATPATTYTMPDGITTGTPEALAPAITSFPAPSSSNPGHVFYCDGDLAISTVTAQTLNGTLIVKGNLTISGINGSVVITPLPQMPAVITSGYIKPNTRNLGITINGVVWAGAGWAWNTGLTGTVVKVDGCLMLPAGAALGNPNFASILATYVAANADVPDIAITPQPVTGVRVLSYTSN